MSNKLTPDTTLMLKCCWLAYDVGIEQVKKLNINIRTHVNADRLPAQNKHEGTLHSVHGLATHKTFVQGFLDKFIPAC